jgi:KaiC/GvpD/RAD55 family RecA-like ATPase
MRIKTGIQGFDQLIEGGLLPNQVYLVCGPPGSGRTTFGIQFLAQGAMENERGLFLAFTENPTNTIKYMSRYSLNLVNYVKEKKVIFIAAGQELFGDETKGTDNEQEEIFDLSTNQTPSKNVLDRIEPIIKKMGIKRLVIDSTSVLPYLIKTREPELKQIGKIINMLKQLGVTTLILSEQENIIDFKFEHYLVSGNIYLHNNLKEPNIQKEVESTNDRAIQIIKMRGTKHKGKLYPIAFTNKGIIIKDIKDF